MNIEEIMYTDQQVIDSIDEIFPPVKIGHLTFNAGQIIYKLDLGYFRFYRSQMPQLWICNECCTVYNNRDKATVCCKEIN